MSARRFVTALLVVLMLASLVGCAQKQEPAAPATQEPTASQAPAEGQPKTEDKLEVFSWWTSGGEAAALDALFSAYRSRSPSVEIINATVAGGGGSAARPVLQTRLAGGDPPDTWQVHPGWELIGQYVEPGYAEPITALYEEEGWYKVVPEGLVSLLKYTDGQIYSVLAGIHRGNGFWYNKKLLDQHSITVGATMSVDEFLTAADKLKAAGVAALCLGDSGIWTSAQLFENTLLGVIGPEKYLGLWNGSVAFDSPEVKQAMQVYGRMLDYVNSDHAALSWDQAVKKLMEGGCAFNSMGDWAYGEFVNAKLQDNVDFGWVSHPGSDGGFMVVADGFTLAKGAPHPENTKNWLRAIGSKEAQEAFNPLKGSIPVRTDVDRSKFGPYHNWAMDSFSRATVVPSVVHGTAAPAAFQQALNDAVPAFMVDRNVDAFAKALADGARAAGISK